MPIFESSARTHSVRGLEQRDFILRWSKRLACGALGCALVFAGHRGYVSWRQAHLERQTQQFIAKGELGSAVLVARRLLAMNENNLAASRAMAEMAEHAGKPEAVSWRKRVARLEPNVPANHLALAKSALRFGQTDLAENVLKALPESARHGAAYHQISGVYALSRGDAAAAATHFGAALEVEPANANLALNVALLQLSAPVLEKAAAARARLVELSRDPAVRLEALRALTSQALARSEKTEAQKWATELREHRDAGFSDALLYFQAVQDTAHAASALEELKGKALTSATTCAELITWLNRQGLAAVALDWIPRLAPAATEVAPVPLAIAESFSFTQDWAGLLRHVEGKNWGASEALRLAVQSHALHRLSPPERPSAETQAVWRAALTAAGRHPEQMIAIAQLAEGWGYQNEAEEAWWLVVNSNEHSRTGLSALQRFYKGKQDTRGLFRVAKRAVELNPKDLIAANNCASLGLLLSADSTARRLAAKLHSEHPTNRAFAATHAYGLHTEGKTAEALRLMESLQDEALRYPSIAAYYVIMLVQDGQLERARPYLLDAKRAALLPEEQQLLTAATRKLLPGEMSGVAQR